MDFERGGGGVGWWGGERGEGVLEGGEEGFDVLLESPLKLAFWKF